MKRLISAALAAVILSASIHVTGIQTQAGEVQEEAKDISQCTFVEMREELRYAGSGERLIMLPPQKYTGNEIKPEITIKDGDYTLVEGTDYSVSSMSLADNVNINTNPWMIKSVTGVNDRITGLRVIGKGNYKGGASCTFAILSEQQKETEDHLIYSDKIVLEGYNGVTIDGYVGAETEVTIPTHIDGKPVQEINEDAFAYNPTLEKVNISDNVFRIMENAFYHCENLKSVELSRQLWGIDTCAFADCTSLKEIFLPQTMEEVGNHIFSGCLSMEAVHSESEVIYDVEGVLFETNGGFDDRTNELYFYPPKRQTETFYIPDGVQSIYADAFRDVGCIGNIIVPSSVRLIMQGQYGSFYGMTNPVNIIYKHDEPSTLPQGILAPDTFYDLPAGSTVTVKNQAMKEAAEAAVSERCRDNVTVQIATKASEGFKLVKNAFLLSKGEQAQLRWNQEPVDTTENIIWQSSDESVAKVDPVLGKITTHGYGECIVTGTDESGHKQEADVVVFDACSSHSLKIMGWTGADWLEGAAECTVALGEEDIYLEAEANGYAGAHEVIYKSENEDVATVRVAENNFRRAYLDIKKPGTVVITASFDNHNDIITDSVTIHVVKTISELPKPDNPTDPDRPGNPGNPQNPENKKQEHQLQYKKSYQKTFGSKPFSLNVKRKKGNGALSYLSSNKKVITVSPKGVVTIMGTGRAVVTVTAGETEKYRKKTAKITVDVTPKKQQASVKTLKGKKIIVKWKKDARTTGYQVQYSMDRKFKKGVKTKKIGRYKTTSKIMKGLKKGKNYYIRVRSYKNIKSGGKTKALYGTWSGIVKSKKI